MSTKTTVLIILLTIFTSALVIYSLILDSQRHTQTSVTPTPKPSLTPVQKTATLGFEPQILTVNPYRQSTASAEIVLHSPENHVSGIQIELLYDPNVLTSVTFATPSSVFWAGSTDNAVQKYANVDATAGRISYIADVKNPSAPQSGGGAVISLIFRFNPRLFTTNTKVTFLEKSVVSEQDTNESVLFKTTNLTIQPLLPTPVPTYTSTGSALPTFTPHP